MLDLYECDEIKEHPWLLNSPYRQRYKLEDTKGVQK
jgi:hypothetical protein